MAVINTEIIPGPTILAGESLSDAIDCSAGRVTLIICPDKWDAADLAFQVSVDDVNYNELFWSDGREFIMIASAGRAINVYQSEYVPQLWVKFRSGTGGVHIPQVETRVFTTVLIV